MKSLQPIVLIDRDGTLNVERNYLSDPADIELLPQAADGIKILRELNLPVVVVTNQSGIGRGFFDRVRLAEIHDRLDEILRENGTSIDRIYFCPHLSADSCDCRKPLPGLAREAAADFNADLSKSFVVGDKASDIAFGANVGATTILVQTGYGKIVSQQESAAPDHTVENLFAAAKLIEKILKENAD